MYSTDGLKEGVGWEGGGGQGTGIVRINNIIVFCLKHFLKVKIELNLKSNLKDIF